MTLSSFVSGGHEVPGTKLLLIVTAIHPQRKLQKRYPPSSGRPPQMTDLLISEIELADRTEVCKLTLFDHPSPAFAVGTVLLFTNPALRRASPACLVLGAGGLIDADPEMGDIVEGLRKWAEKERRLGTKRQWMGEDVVRALEGTVGEAGLYSLAELEERVRDGEGGGVWTAWLSLVLGRVDLVRVVRRGMAGVGEWQVMLFPCLLCLLFIPFLFWSLLL